MKLNFGGLPLDDVLSNKDLKVSIEEDLVLLEEKVSLLKELLGSNGNEVGMEGLVKDVVKTTLWTAPKTLAKGGSNVYKEVNKQHRQMKTKWSRTIKPLIIKTIKEMGNILQNIYFKFSKFDERYSKLGKKIDFILNQRIKQVGSLSTESFYIHPFNAEVLKGYTVIINDYSEFYQAVVDVMIPDWLSAKEVDKAMKSKDLSKLSKGSVALSNAIGEINEFGDITIPWAVYKDKRYTTFFDVLFRRKPSANDMKSSLSDYIKKTILGPETEMTYKIKQRKMFIEEMGDHLSIVSSVLNNNVLNKALKGGGETLKKQTTKFFKEIEGLSKSSISILTKDPKEKKEENKNEEKEVVSSDERLNTELENYMSNSLTLLTKTSTAYTGIVRGTLSALYTVVTDAEEICEIIEASVDEQGGK